MNCDESVKDYHLYYIDDVSFVVATEPNINPAYERSECSWSEPGLSFHRTLNNAPEIRIKIDITVKNKVDRSANHYALMRNISAENKHR